MTRPVPPESAPTPSGSLGPASPRRTPIGADRAPLRTSCDAIERLSAVPLAVRATAVDAWWASLESLPLVGEPRTVDGVDCVPVTFATRGEHDEAMVYVNSVTDRHRENVVPALMERLDGTDLWHLTWWLPSDLMASYKIVHGAIPRNAGRARPGWRRIHERGRADPLNGHALVDPLGEESSVLVGPHSSSHPAWVPGDSTRTGDPVVVRELAPHDPYLDTVRPVWLHSSAEATWLVVLFDGEHWRLHLPAALAEWGRDDVAVAMVSSVSPQARGEVLPVPERAAALVEHTVLPAVEEATGRSWAADRIVVSGQSFGGLAAASIAVRRPDLARTAVAQSSSFWFRPGIEPVRGACEPGELVESLGAGADASTSRVHLTWGSEEEDIAFVGAAFAEAAYAAGAAVTVREYAGGHDYAWWRSGLLDGLDHVLGEGPSPADPTVASS